MKKKLLLVLALVAFLSLGANAQIKFGIRAGVPFTASDLSSDGLKLETNQPFNVGLTTDIIAPLIGLGVEASALFELNKLSINTLDKKVSSGMLKVPINLKWKIGLPKIIKFYVAAGPYFDFKLYGDAIDMTSLISYETKSMSWGLNAGLGVELFGKLQVGVSYYYAMSDSYEKVVRNLVGGDFNKEGFSRAKGAMITAAFLF